ncbi:sialidase family protein [Actinomadura oligospora]|uniref:sialidase family protein n=1 Tax=Actinomadura oligospora TaxID=111804 RepID=UPI0004AC5AA1|nr:hypothetical protein [Actinomadura oligospora]
MKSLVTLIATAGIGLSLFPGTAGAATSADAGSAWRQPNCKTVEGDGSVSFTRDGGRSVAPTTGVMRPVKYVMGLEALARPNQLLAVDDRGQLERSIDAGCSWSTLASLSRFGHWSISPASDGTAYVWNFRGDRVYRVDGELVSKEPAFDAERLGGLVTLTVDQRKPGHLRGVTEEGQVLDSRDSGRSFRSIGAVPVKEAGPNFLLYDAKVAPSRPNDIVVGISDVGAFTSHNGGRTWRRTKIGQAGDKVNGFTVAMSPIDPRIVYLQALNVTEMDRGGRGGGRHLYRSADGGRSFRPVADQGGEVTITNGGLVKPSPWNRDVVYFEYGDPVYRTSLYTLNTRTRELSIARNPHDSIKSIAFNPGARDVMYLGFVEER